MQQERLRAVLQKQRSPCAADSCWLQSDAGHISVLRVRQAERFPNTKGRYDARDEYPPVAAHVDLQARPCGDGCPPGGDETSGLSRSWVSYHVGRDGKGFSARGIDDPIAKDHAKALDAVATKQAGMAQVTKEYSGAMATYSRHSAGATSNLANSMEVLGQKVGQMLLPIISTLVGVLQKMVGPLGAIFNILKPLLPLVIGVALAWAAYKGVMVVASAATFVMQGALAALTLIATLQTAGVEGLALAWGSLDVAMQANVIGLIVVAIAALVLGIIYAYNHVRWFRDFVNAAWNAIKDVTSSVFRFVKGVIVDVFDWIKGHWPYLAAALTGPFAPFLEIVALVITHFKLFKSVVTDVVDWVIREFNRMLHFFEGLPGAVARLGKGLWSGLKHGLVDVLNWIIDKFNALPLVHGMNLPFGIHIPGVPKMHHIGGMAAGGSITQTGPYLVGERGPELVTLPRGSYVTPNQGLNAPLPSNAQAASTAPPQELTLVIYNMLDGKPISKSVVRQGLLQQSRGG